MANWFYTKPSRLDLNFRNKWTVQPNIAIPWNFWNHPFKQTNYLFTFFRMKSLSLSPNFSPMSHQSNINSDCDLRLFCLFSMHPIKISEELISKLNKTDLAIQIWSSSIFGGLNFILSMTLWREGLTIDQFITEFRWTIEREL